MSRKGGRGAGDREEKKKKRGGRRGTIIKRKQEKLLSLYCTVLYCTVLYYIVCAVQCVAMVYVPHDPRVVHPLRSGTCRARTGGSEWE